MDRAFAVAMQKDCWRLDDEEVEWLWNLSEDAGRDRAWYAFVPKGAYGVCWGWSLRGFRLACCGSATAGYWHAFAEHSLH